MVIIPCLDLTLLHSRVVHITPSSWIKLLPVVFVFLLVYYLRKHLSFWKSEWFRGVSNFLHFESFLMGISMGPILILNIMAENDSNMIDLVLTHLTHPWGLPWTLATLGDHWRHAWKWSFWPFSGIGIGNRAISPLKFPLKTKSDRWISVLGL